MADSGAGNSSPFFSALSNLQNSTNGLNTNFQAPTLTGFQNPGYQNLGQNVPWNMSGSDFGSTSAVGGTGGGSGGGFWSNVGGFFSGLYDHLKGGMEGAAAGYAGYNPPDWEKTQNPNQDSLGQAFQREFDMSGLGGIANAFKGGFNGLVNDPQQAQQDYQQHVISPFNSMPVVPRFGNQFLANTATDPLTYVPVGTIAKATGITPALKFGFDWARGAAKGGDAAASLSDTVGNIARSSADDASAVTKEMPLTKPPQGYSEDINKWADLDGGYVPSTRETALNNVSDLQNELGGLEQQRGSLAKEFMQGANASNADSVVNQLKGLGGVRRPLQDDAFYSEWKGLPDNIKRIFMPGSAGQSAMSLDEAAQVMGKDASSLIDALKNGKSTYSLADAMQHPTVSDLNEAIDHFNNLIDEAHGAVPPEGPGFELKGSPFTKVRDDQSLIPISNPYTKAAEEVAAGVADAGAQATKAPYAAYAWQSKLGAPLAQKMLEMAPNGVPVIRSLLNNRMTDALGKMFVRFHGATPAVADALRDMENAKNADLQNIITTMRGMAQKHGLSDDEMTQVVHLLEGIHPGGASDRVTSAAADLRDLMENGLSTPEGRVLGANHELGTVDHAGRPTLDAAKMRENYYPHKYNEAKTPTTPNGNRKVFSTKGASNKERTFNTVLDAQKAGYKPEMNPYIAVGQRLAESSQKIRNAQLLAKLQDAGILSKEAGDGLRSAGAIDQLNGHYVPASDLAALKSFLVPHQPGVFLNAYDKGLGAWKKVSLLNSLVHGHNVAYNGMLLGGAKPAYVKEAFGALKDGGGDQWFQRALRAGAISADRGGFLNNLKSAVKGVSNPVRDKINYALHGALWDFDKSMRTAIFRQAVEGGATDAEAAARANKFLVDYNNMTPFESQVVSRVLPFYRWMKGNMPLQVEQWINNTPKQMLYQHAKQAIQQSLTGQNLRPDGKIDTGIVQSDGSHVLIDPYSPSDEPLKALQEGIAPYLYGKLNPVVKLASQLASNQKYYPSAFFAPNGKESMASQPITKPGRDDNSASVINQILSNIIPSTGLVGSAASNLTGAQLDTRGLISSTLGLPTKDKPTPTVAELLTQLLGGFSSRDNPALDAYYQQKDAQDALKNQISEMYQQGIPIPKSLTKQEYAKIPYPGTGTGN